MASELVIIALMGLTGSGRSNFINKLTGAREEESAGQLRSHTQGIRETRIKQDTRQYVFVDTPGFDDTDRDERDILRTIAEWLERSYRGNLKLTDNRMSASVCNYLHLFHRLCGERAAERVRLVTTMWDNVRDVNLAERRALQLETIYWRPLIDAGSRHERFNNSSRSAWEIVRGLAGEGRALLIQEEMVDAERGLDDTAAGKTLTRFTQFKKALQEKKQAIKRLLGLTKTRS
ncbi:P-loop containing nucleoside triphosphate hydrolase protein [Pisolithus marmoratus]|nr:P-loop containing nucleoside triphosphate hydrolase protein [Pisolithus marmoratus]